MVTTRRSSDMNSSLINSDVKGSVDLLERAPRSYGEFTADNTVSSESYEETRLRMQRNLDLLLNYDKNPEQAEAVASDVAEQEISEITAREDEDICPTSTTMQFGDGDLDQMYKEMNRAKEDTKENYKLTTKGKIIVGIYAAVVAIIFALIILNTSLLAVLSSSNAEKSEILTAQTEHYNSLLSEVNSISDDAYISDIAENQYGMIMGN
ncbi:MAG: hypothetical protein IJW47_01215 [Clostridia bacterium]|nr:hypothetical protein [Clostridia bacterium]